MYVIANKLRSLTGSRSVGRFCRRARSKVEALLRAGALLGDLFVSSSSFGTPVLNKRRCEEGPSTTLPTSLSSRLLSPLLRFFVTAFALVAFLFVGVWLLTCLAALPALNTTHPAFLPLPPRPPRPAPDLSQFVPPGHHVGQPGSGHDISLVHDRGANGSAVSCISFNPGPRRSVREPKIVVRRMCKRCASARARARRRLTLGAYSQLPQRPSYQ